MAKLFCEQMPHKKGQEVKHNGFSITNKMRFYNLIWWLTENNKCKTNGNNIWHKYA